MASCLVWLASLALLASNVVARTHGKEASWLMPQHSFDRTLTFDDYLSNWTLSASTMALRDRLQLLPNVADRYGIMFSNQSIQTNDFEFTIVLSATDNGDGKGGPQDAFVGFWLANAPFTFNETEVINKIDGEKKWADGMAKYGLSPLCVHRSFRGVGVMFTDEVARGTSYRSRQIITAIRSDGLPNDVKSYLNQATPDNTKQVDWMTPSTTLKVRVKPDGSVTGSAMTLDIDSLLNGNSWTVAWDGVTPSDQKVTFSPHGKMVDSTGKQGTWSHQRGNRIKIDMPDLKCVLRFEASTRAIVEEPYMDVPAAILYDGPMRGGSEKDWIKIFDLPPSSLQQGNVFMGITGFSGFQSRVEVDIHRLTTMNFNIKVMGEAEGDGFFSQEWAEILEQEKRYVNQASQTEALERLTKMLKEHMEKYKSTGEDQRKQLIHLEDKLDKLGMQMAQYKAAAESFSWDSKKLDHEAVKRHITGIKTLLVRHKEQHDEQLNRVQAAAAKMKDQASAHMTPDSKAKVEQVASQSKAVIEAASRGSSQTHLLLFFMVLTVAGLGFLFLNRMRYYEKKHYF